jgi:hypothetical protein
MQWQYLCEEKTRFGQSIPRKRGHVVIDDGDGHEYHYNMSGISHMKKQFKSWAEQVFCNYGEHKLVGKWPYYHVERRQ